MEQHPVPRNISSFQFHLIGEMTLRQFGYLAGGIAIAYVIVKLAPFPTIIKAPIAAIPALAGFAFAFLPIQERPLDKWLLAFIKSINSPTQYLWHKDQTVPDILLRTTSPAKKTLTDSHQEAHHDARNKLQTYLASIPSQPHQTLNIKEKNYIDKTLLLFDTPTHSAISPTLVPDRPSRPAAQSSKPAVPTVHQPLKDPPQPVIMPAVETVKIPTAKPIRETLMPKPDVQDREKEIAKIVREKETMASELAKLKEQLEKISKPDVIKPQPEAEVKKPTIKTISPKTAVNEIGMPKFPQTPNIIMGVIKDTQNKLLPNIILTIKDTKGMPHRALKTNRLGQFAIATPLPSDTYHIESEDPLKRYTFDIAEVTLAGKVFLPVEITAKGEKEVMREKLTKELFGNPSVI